MVEVYTAIQSGIELVLVNVEEAIDWAVAWPREKTLASYPFAGGKLKWGAAAFSINRQTVLDKLTGNNSYPRPTIYSGMDADHANGNVTREWAKKGGYSVLCWIVRQVGGSLPDFLSTLALDERPPMEKLHPELAKNEEVGDVPHPADEQSNEHDNVLQVWLSVFTHCILQAWHTALCVCILLVCHTIHIHYSTIVLIPCKSVVSSIAGGYRLQVQSVVLAGGYRLQVQSVA
jgi:hypothetical protein